MRGTGTTFSAFGPEAAVSSAKIASSLLATSSARPFCRTVTLAVWVCIQSTSKDSTTSTSALRSSWGPLMRIMFPTFEARTDPERAMKLSTSSMIAAGPT